MWNVQHRFNYQEIEVLKGLLKVKGQTVPDNLNLGVLPFLDNNSGRINLEKTQIVSSQASVNSILQFS